MKFWISRKIWQIKNVIKWLPKIWNQYDFDYHYSIEVFRFQLQKQAEYLNSPSAMTQCAKDKAKRIQTILKLMDKVYNEEYALEYQEMLKAMYGEDVLEIKFIEDKSKPTMYRMVHKYESWDNADEIEEIHGKLFKMSHEKQNRAHKLLWKLVERNIRDFWD